MSEQNQQQKSPLSTVSINGDKVRSIRESKGLTQLYIATTLGVTTDTVSRWENRRYPTIKWENVEKLAQALEVDVSEILEEAEVEQSNILPFHSRRIIIPLLAAIPVILIIFWIFSTFPVQRVNVTATRFLPRHTPANQPFPVIIKVESDSDKPFSFILQETLPDTCTPIKGVPPFIKQEAETKTLKWITNSKESPYFLAYLAIAETIEPMPGKLDFEGLIKVDKNQDDKQGTEGNTSILIANHHWADSDANNQIDDAEILAIYNSFDALSDLGVDLNLIKSIWSGKGYALDPESQLYTVIR